MPIMATLVRWRLEFKASSAVPDQPGPHDIES